jgi:hypothetical protein
VEEVLWVDQNFGAAEDLLDRQPESIFVLETGSENHQLVHHANRIQPQVCFDSTWPMVVGMDEHGVCLFLE